MPRFGMLVQPRSARYCSTFCRLALAKEWTNGYDKELVIKNKNLYDLRAIPTLYLLDKNKTVLLKDATLQKVEPGFCF